MFSTQTSLHRELNGAGTGRCLTQLYGDQLALALSVRAWTRLPCNLSLRQTVDVVLPCTLASFDGPSGNVALKFIPRYGWDDEAYTIRAPFKL